MRPRERLAARGAQALSDDEVLAILIGHGTTRRSALVLANLVLREIGGLRALGQADAASLSDAALGDAKLGPATAARVVAACELGRRVAMAGSEGERCDTPELAAVALGPHFAHLERECLAVALLSRKQRLLRVTPIYMGHVAGTPVRIAELFAEALKRQAPALILAHNHPSGDPTPSADDIRTTREAASAGRLLGIEVVDHLVFGMAGRWVSLKRIGALT
jgi:DNA repair protein RadC